MFFAACIYRHVYLNHDELAKPSVCIQCVCMRECVQMRERESKCVQIRECVRVFEGRCAEGYLLLKASKHNFDLFDYFLTRWGWPTEKDSGLSGLQHTWSFKATF